MNSMSILSVLGWVGLTLSVVLTVLAYVGYEKIGRMIGTGAGGIICGVVLVAGIFHTTLDSLLFTGGAVLAAASSFAFVRDFKKRGRQEPGKSS